MSIKKEKAVNDVIHVISFHYTLRRPVWMQEYMYMHCQILDLILVYKLTKISDLCKNL